MKSPLPAAPLIRRLAPDFDPYQLLDWLVEARWTDGRRLVEHAGKIAPKEERQRRGSARALVAAATGWLYERKLIEIEPPRDRGQGTWTETELAGVTQIWTTKEGYQLLDARGLDQFSGTVVPIFVAFSVPTVTLIVTTDKWAVPPSPTFRLLLAGLFIASSGCFLASFQCGVGSVKRAVTGTVRAILTYLGLAFLWAGLIVLVIPLVSGLTLPFQILSAIAMCLLTIGVALPIWLRIRDWARTGGLRTCWYEHGLKSNQA
jgi:hypothetical protein